MKKDKPFIKFSKPEVEEWIDKVLNSEDPNNSRKFSSPGWGTTHLTPRGENSFHANPWEVIKKMQDFETPYQIMSDVIKKSYIGIEDSMIKIWIEGGLGKNMNKIFESIYRKSLDESLADGFSGIPRARALLSEALETIASAAQAIRDDEEDRLDDWNRLGEIYAELKEFWAKL